MDAKEFRFRIAQKFRIQREQWQLIFDGRHSAGTDHWWRHWDAAKVTDSALRAAVNTDDGTHAATLLPEYLATRAAPVFFWNPSERSPLVAELGRLFPSLGEKTRTRAEAICAHRFHILAYPEVSCGGQIPWRRDLVHGIESELEHYARLSPLNVKKVGDSKIVWEINRHQHFLTLCQSYLITGEEHFAEECLKQWEDWTRENPYLRGINWASSLEVAFRSWSWLWTLFLLVGSRALTGDRIGRMTQSLYRNAEFIAKNLSIYFAPNTHLLGEGFALFTIGLLLPELRNSSRWYEHGRRILSEGMQNQVCTDGSHIEQSTFYHRYAVEIFLCAAILADRNGCSFPASYRARLEKMLEFLVHTAWPSGHHPSIGDSDGGRLISFGSFDPEDHRPVLSTGAVHFRRGDFRRAAGTLHEQTVWLLGPDAGPRFSRLDSAPPSPISRTFPDSGLVTMRNAWSRRAKFLAFDAGPQGMKTSGHGHADSLSILCGANGVEWIVDPGTYVYSASRPWRDFFRSTPAHNTIAVDGFDQAVRVDLFKWRKLPQVCLEQSISNSYLDFAVGSHNGYSRLEEPVLHRRNVIFVKPHYWIISDELTGQGQHDIGVFFHFAPRVSLQRVEEGWLARNGEEQFLLAPLAPNVQFRVVTSEESPIQGWYSSDYGHREPSPVLVGEITTTVPTRFHWLLWPMESEMPRFRELSREKLFLSVETKTWTDLLITGERARVFAEDDFSTDGQLALLRRQSAGLLERMVLIGGNSIFCEGKSMLTAEKPFGYFAASWRTNSLDIEMNPSQSFRVHSSAAVSQVWINSERAKLRETDSGLEFQGET